VFHSTSVCQRCGQSRRVLRWKTLQNHCSDQRRASNRWRGLLPTNRATGHAAWVDSKVSGYGVELHDLAPGFLHGLVCRQLRGAWPGYKHDMGTQHIFCEPELYGLRHAADRFLSSCDFGGQLAPSETIRQLLVTVCWSRFA
jgi:hypothetical protein